MKEISRREFLKGASAGTAILAMHSLFSFSAFAEAAEPEESAAPEENAAAEEVSPLDMPVYCVDRFVTNPGEGEDFLKYYMDNFQAKAESYGMELQSTMVSPPVWLNNASNTIEVTWKIAGFNGWAVMVNASRYEPETLAFWREVRTKVVSEDRSYYAKQDDMEALNNV